MAVFTFFATQNISYTFHGVYLSFFLIILQALLDRFLVFTSVLEEHALVAVVDSLVRLSVAAAVLPIY